MIGANGGDPDVRVRVTPEPEPEELAAIVAVLRARRRPQKMMAVAEGPSRPVSRWARAGREEAMAGHDRTGDRW